MLVVLGMIGFLGCALAISSARAAFDAVTQTRRYRIATSHRSYRAP